MSMFLPGEPMLPFLAGGAEMGQRLRRFDWNATSLGPPARWPAPLRGVVRLMLTTPHPVLVFWGPGLVCLYNDAFARSLGAEQHPSMLGLPARQAWPEIWPVIGPQIGHVMRGEGATWHENQRLPILRHGRLEEACWTYGCSPIDDEYAPHGVGGVLVLITETTRQSRSLEQLEQLDTVMAAAEIGVWCWDVQRNLIEQDLNLARLYGLAESRRSTPEQHLACIHADDRAAMQAALDSALDTGYFHVRGYRVRLANGSMRWLAGRGRLQRDAQGRPQRLTALVIDITDLKAMEESLKASEGQKDEFLAILAHELRNPLAPLLNAAQVLAVQPLGQRELMWCRDVIQRQVRHMAVLLDDLLDLSGIKHGRLRLARQSVALAGIVEAAVETAMPLIDSRQHQLDVELPAQPLLLEVDPGRIAQVLANLLGNAAKYTEPGGRITLAARVSGDEVELSVRDNGIGLAAQDMEHIFEMFSQTEAGAGRAQGGLGIGLGLVKGLVELHGGRVRVESAGVGHGSTFIVTLPALAQTTAAVAPQPQPQDTPAPVGWRILIADDNADAAETLAMFLQLQGHQTRVAHNGGDALAACAEFGPDIALIDIGMPDLNGYQVGERIRAQPQGDGVLLAALTGWGQEQNKLQAHAAGFDLHFTKPVDPDELLRTLAEHAAQRLSPSRGSPPSAGVATGVP